MVVDVRPIRLQHFWCHPCLHFAQVTYEEVLSLFPHGHLTFDLPVPGLVLDGVDAGSKNCLSLTGVLVTDEFSEYKPSLSSANESVTLIRTFLSSLRVGNSVDFFVAVVSDIIIDKQAVGVPG